MTKPEDQEEQQHLATLDDLEATQEEIASYQGLLKDIPEIYERKFNERLQPILERRQELIEAREQLIHQIHRSLPVAGERATLLLQASPPPPSETEAEGLPTHQTIKRVLGLLAVVAMGISAGVLLSRQVPSKPANVSPSPSPIAPSHDRPQDRSVPNTAPSLRNRVVDQAIAEWAFFGSPLMQDGILIRKGKQEGDDGQWQRIRSYWRDGVLNNSVLRREDVISTDKPWSAAFLSYIMKKAGAGDRFPYSPIHAAQIKQAIDHRMLQSQDSSFMGHRVSDYAPRPGDLICATRLWARNEVTYDNVDNYDFFPSRCELVIGSGNGAIDVIGGDFMDSIMRQKIKTLNGKIAPKDAKNWLVVMEAKFD